MSNIVPFPRPPRSPLSRHDRGRRAAADAYVAAHQAWLRQPCRATEAARLRALQRLADHNPLLKAE